MIMNPDEIIAQIRDAFKDVRKGRGIGLREASALDDYASAEEQLRARDADTEEHWWELVPRFEGEIGTALSFTDIEGFKFLLPAAITLGIDGGDWYCAHSVLFHLCLHPNPYKGAPHHGHREYVDFMRSIHPRETIAYYSFTSLQITAIARFFKWYMQHNESHLYEDPAKGARTRDARHDGSTQGARPGDYVLTRDDVEEIHREECRILKEWLELGKVAAY